MRVLPRHRRNHTVVLNPRNSQLVPFRGNRRRPSVIHVDVRRNRVGRARPNNRVGRPISRRNQELEDMETASTIVDMMAQSDNGYIRGLGRAGQKARDNLRGGRLTGGKELAETFYDAGGVDAYGKILDKVGLGPKAQRGKSGYYDFITKQGAFARHNSNPPQLTMPRGRATSRRRTTRAANVYRKLPLVRRNASADIRRAMRLVNRRVGRRVRASTPAVVNLKQPLRLKWKRKIPSLRFKGICMQSDYLDNVTSAVQADGKAGSVYVGHYTHPMQQVIYSLAMAWAKFIAVKASGYIPRHVNERIGGEQNTAKGDMKLEVYYRRSPESDLIVADTSITITGVSETVKTLADKLRDLMYDLQENVQFISATEKAEVHYEGFALCGDAGVDAYKNRRYDMKDIRVTIQGLSKLKMCNTSTASDVSGTDDDTVRFSKDSIFHVPLECRGYFGKGSQFNMRLSTLAAAPNWAEGQIKFDDINGMQDFNDLDPNNPNVEDILKYPPRYAVWYGCKTQGKGFHLNPGKFTTSTLKKTHSLKFNQWIKICRRKLALAKTITGSATNHKTSIGLAKWYGFHKKFEHSVASPSQITIEYEHHLKMTALMTYKRRKVITATDSNLEANAA